MPLQCKKNVEIIRKINKTKRENQQEKKKHKKKKKRKKKIGGNIGKGKNYKIKAPSSVYKIIS